MGYRNATKPRWQSNRIGEEDTNGKGTQEKVPEENDFFAVHDSSVISDAGIGARLFGPTKSA